MLDVQREVTSAYVGCSKRKLLVLMLVNFVGQSWQQTLLLWFSPLFSARNPDMSRVPSHGLIEQEHDC